MSFLGDMKLPGILVEKGDNLPPEELAARLVSLVASGTEGWASEIVHETGVSDEELSLAKKYLVIQRFEVLFRNCVVAALREKYEKNAEDRINEALENELDGITARVKAEAQRYGQDAPVLDLTSLLQFLGFEHYVKLFENSGMWSKCLGKIFKDQHQAVEGLKSIRDARNEISHFRATIHSNLWATASMYMEILEGRVRMMDPAFLRLVQLAERKPVMPKR
jgi:hypothetical protein